MMLEDIILPEELNISISSESKDFAVKGNRAKPIGASVSRILFGAVWLGFVLFIMSMFLGPVFKGDIIQNFKDVLASKPDQENQQGGLFLLLFFGLFVVIGLFMLLGGIFSLFKKGGYYVATPTRLVHYKNGQLKSSDWEQFTGNIEVKGSNKRGSITLEMRTGYMVSGKGGSRYVPNVVYISGIPNVYEIEEICRRRIKENDPTPAV